MKRIKPIILMVLFLPASIGSFGQNPATTKKARDTSFPKADSLKAAIVTAVLRPRMKGDTLEYNTGNIRLQPNANVEELLRRLPGLQVDADGNITFNGERIQHLLVDGQDIFGSDPTLVTRNFDAIKIERIEILDRKSDQAVFTGIDDGNRTKTLNLVLKESAKNGYFGKAEAGGNLQGYYNANVTLAAFRNKEQFTALGMASNTGTLKTASNDGVSGSSVSFQSGGSDPLGASAGNGIPRFAAAALHYANTWSSSGEHAEANYQYSHYFTQPITSTTTLQSLNGSNYEQYQQSRSSNQQDQHWMQGMYEYTPNSKTGFRLAFHGNVSEGPNQFSAASSSVLNDTLVNTGIRNIQDKVIQRNFQGEALWRLQVGGMAGRIFFISTSIAKVENTTNGYLYATDQFYNPNGNTADTVDQRKEISSKPLTIGGAIGLSQPLWKEGQLGMSYGYSVTTDDPLQATFDRGDGKYQQVVDSLTTNFQTKIENQDVLLNVSGKLGKLSFTVGNNFLVYRYQQHDALSDSLVAIHYFNANPHLFANYLVNPMTFFHFEYNASTQQPSINQLEPAKNNNDPLHITLGNPNLRPGFTQNFKFLFTRMKAWQIHFNIIGSFTSNSISTRTITDSLGRQITEPVNVSGGGKGTVNFSMNKRLAGFDLTFITNGNYSRNYNYSNAALCRNDGYSGGGGFIIAKYVPDIYNIRLNGDGTYFDEVSSLNANNPIHYWTATGGGSVSLYLLRNFELNTNGGYTWQQKTSAFASNTTVTLWNAAISRNFLNNRLVASIQINNILDQHVGISRTNVANINTQTSTNVLGRYWMFAATFHFDKKFKHN